MAYAIHGLLHLLTAVVAVALCMTLGLTTPSVRIVEVNSDLIMQRFAQEMRAGSDEEIALRTSAFLRDMEVVLAVFARDNGVVVVDAELAIAGAHDVTDQAFEAALLRQIGLSEGGQ